jgi:hypothetical protein
MKFRFSAEELMTCCPFCSDDAFVTTCRTGGNAAKALVYWITNGVVSGGHLDSTVTTFIPFSLNILSVLGVQTVLESFVLPRKS